MGTLKTASRDADATTMVQPPAPHVPVPRPRAAQDASVDAPRTVIAHDYLTQRGGAERIVLSLSEAFPGAPVVTSVYEPAQTFPALSGLDIRTGPLQRVAAFRRDPRLALPLLAGAWRRTVVPDTDVVVANTTGWAHGVHLPDSTALVAYCHNPARWLYQPEDYLPKAWQRAALSPLRGPLTRWDQQAAGRVDTYVANSRNVASRIERTYGREALIVHCPMSLDVTGEQEPVPGLEPGFWLTVGRGRAYKNTRAVIDGIRDTGSPLAVVGTAPPDEERRSSVTWLGIVSEAQLRWLYANARALVAVAYEDFGLTPVEANAFGTPVAVLRAGGYLETTVEGVSGVFIEEPTAAAVADTLRRFPHFDAEAVRRNADRFSSQAFAARMQEIAATALAARRGLRAPLPRQVRERGAAPGARV